MGCHSVQRILELSPCRNLWEFCVCSSFNHVISDSWSHDYAHYYVTLKTIAHHNHSLLTIVTDKSDFYAQLRVYMAYQDLRRVIWFFTRYFCALHYEPRFWGIHIRSLYGRMDIYKIVENRIMESIYSCMAIRDKLPISMQRYHAYCNSDFHELVDIHRNVLERTDMQMTSLIFIKMDL